MNNSQSYTIQELEQTFYYVYTAVAFSIIFKNRLDHLTRTRTETTGTISNGKVVAVRFVP